MSWPLPYSNSTTAATQHLNSITLCGPSRSKCGYCQGSRTAILATPNPFVKLLRQPQLQHNGEQENHPQSPTSPIIIHPETTNGNDNSNSNSSNNMNSNSNSNIDDQNEIVTTSTSSKAYSILASSIDPSDYQTLLDRGWRRSGDLLYRPKNWECCCPSHPIRLDVNRFRIGKSQKKVLKQLRVALCAGNQKQNEYQNQAMVVSVGGVDNCQGKEKLNGKNQVQGQNQNQHQNQGRKRARRNTNYSNQQQQKQHQHQHQSNGQSSKITNTNANTGKPSIDQIHHHARDLITKCGVLSILHDRTTQIVEDYTNQQLELELNNNSNNNNNNINNNIKNNNNATLQLNINSKNKINNIIQKSSLFKMTKVEKPKDVHRHYNDGQNDNDNSNATINATTNDWKYNIRITLSTTICPSIHGTTNGKVNKITLANTVVEQLRKDDKMQQFEINMNMNSVMTNGNSNGKSHSHGSSNGHARIYASTPNLKFDSISSHEKSGHVNVVLYLTALMKNSQKNNGKNNSSNMEGKNNNLNDAKKRIETVITNFIQANGEEVLSQNPSLQPPYKLTVKSIPSRISGRDPKVHRLYTKYQAAIHNDPDPFLPAENEDSKMTELWDSYDEEDVKINGGNSTNKNNINTNSTEKLTEQDFDRLYQRGYDEAQRQKIYKSYTDYHRFLCCSPIPNGKTEKTGLRNVTSLTTNASTSRNGGSGDANMPFTFDIKDEDVQIPYGSYHQQYLINDKFLIAVGVIDVLPKCISSVYACYDPVVSRDINLGKLTALYEIEWVKNAQRHRPNLKYYYLGYYIHSCQKMRYKAEYKPSDILCPVQQTWVDFEIAKKRLETRSPIRHICDLATPGFDEKHSIDDNYFSTNNDTTMEESVDLDSIRLSLGPNENHITVNMLRNEGQDIIRPILKEFVQETGLEVARRCVIKLF